MIQHLCVTIKNSTLDKYEFGDKTFQISKGDC